MGRHQQPQSNGQGARHPRKACRRCAQLTAQRDQRQHHLALCHRHVRGRRGSFFAGLEDRVAKGEDVSRISSVASFFVSRIDTHIDETIDARIKAGDAESEALAALRGKVAIANAKLAYQYYLELIASDRWRALAAKGARPQRLLWASTGTKDPAYSDVLYVERLIGRDTINTMPPKTIEAFLDHGVARHRSRRTSKASAGSCPRRNAWVSISPA